MSRKLLLAHFTAPGDIVVMTALLRDLHRAYPGEFETFIDTHHPDIWIGNPYTSKNDQEGAQRFRLNYGPYLNKCYEVPRHFLTAFHADLAAKLNLDIPLTLPKPDLHLLPHEDKPLIKGRYWLMVAGSKSDFTTKQWPYENFQETVDILNCLGIKIVQAGRRGGTPLETHPNLEGVLNLVDKTDIRDLMRLVKYADGVICGITVTMHMAAAFEKPAVILAGGREEWWFTAYTNKNKYLPNSDKILVPHKFLHTFGMLSCCQTEKGCWKTQVLPTKGKYKPHCVYPELVGNNLHVARCLKLISVERVIESVLSYYLEGYLEMPEGMLLPNADNPIEITLPSGKQMIISVQSKDSFQRVETVRNFSLPILQEEPRNNRAILPQDPRPKIINPKDLFSHPIIDGRITVCVFLQGNYYAIHQRCLEAILNTPEVSNLELRVVANSIGPETEFYVNNLLQQGRVFRFIDNKENIGRAGLMKLLWHDQGFPLRTSWVLWIDDDTFVDFKKTWLLELLECIINARQQDASKAIFGPKQIYTISQNEYKWLQQAPWWKGLPLQDKDGRTIPNGNKIEYAVGGFFAIQRNALQYCNLPQSGEAWINAVALWQNGFRLGEFSSNKEVVRWSAVPPRFVEEPLQLNY